MKDVLPGDIGHNKVDISRVLMVHLDLRLPGERVRDVLADG